MGIESTDHEWPYSLRRNAENFFWPGSAAAIELYLRRTLVHSGIL